MLSELYKRHVWDSLAAPPACRFIRAQASSTQQSEAIVAMDYILG
jgi:hypothetical protein